MLPRENVGSSLQFFHLNDQKINQANKYNVLLSLALRPNPS